MKRHGHEEELTADLSALSGVTIGQGIETPPEAAICDGEEAARAGRVAELRAQYQAGTLSADAAAVAAKLVEEHVQVRPPYARASSSQK